MTFDFDPVNEALASGIADRQRKGGGSPPCFVVGLCGAQGSGKSTMARQLKLLLEERSLSVVVISIDDLYKSRAERVALSESVHPLLRTRGVPGTHDVELGLKVFSELGGQGVVPIPAFDKSRDDLYPLSAWPGVRAPVQVIILEGWCVGAVPQEPALLATPINELERTQDPDGAWRRYVNDALAGAYQNLFGLLDMLILLKAPSFDVVYEWRLEQERQLRRQVELEGKDTSGLMTDEAIGRFIAHYERLTRHILTEMPARADIVIELDIKRGKRKVAQPAE